MVFNDNQRLRRLAQLIGDLASAREHAPDGSADQEHLTASHVEEALLGGNRQFTRHEAAARAGVPFEHAERIWRAMGFASQPDDVKAFTEGDVAALTKAGQLLQAG